MDFSTRILDRIDHVTPNPQISMESPPFHLPPITIAKLIVTTPDPFRDVIRTEPAPDLPSLMGDIINLWEQSASQITSNNFQKQQVTTPSPPEILPVLNNYKASNENSSEEIPFYNGNLSTSKLHDILLYNAEIDHNITIQTMEKLSENEDSENLSNRPLKMETINKDVKDSLIAISERKVTTPLTMVTLKEYDVVPIEKTKPEKTAVTEIPEQLNFRGLVKDGVLLKEQKIESDNKEADEQSKLNITLSNADLKIYTSTTDAVEKQSTTLLTLQNTNMSSINDSKHLEVTASNKSNSIAKTTESDNTIIVNKTEFLTENNKLLKNSSFPSCDVLDCINKTESVTVLMSSIDNLKPVLTTDVNESYQKDNNLVTKNFYVLRPDYELGNETLNLTVNNNLEDSISNLNGLQSQSSLDSGPASGLLKLAGCNIYGRMYRVGRIILELSGPCLECMCTEVGVQCRPLTC